MKDFLWRLRSAGRRGRSRGLRRRSWPTSHLLASQGGRVLPEQASLRINPLKRKLRLLRNAEVGVKI
jgi:hypothetical protein